MRVFIDALGVDEFNSGLSGYSINILKRLSAYKDIKLTVLCNPRGLPRIKKIVRHDCDFEVKNLSVLGLDRDKYYFLNKRKIEKNNDLFHCLSSYLSFIKLPIPSIVTLHDLKYFVCPSFNTGLRSFVIKKYIENTIKNADKIISVSISTRHDAVISGADVEKITVIREGPCITPDMFSAVSASNNELPSSFFLFVGEDRPHKNIRRLIDAFVGIENEVDYYLIIAGKGTEGLSGYSDSERVLCLGAVTDEKLAVLYSNAKSFVFPSLYEGFGLPIIEAMSFGLPVITSMVTSTREIGGDMAEYVDPYDSGQISGAMLAMVENIEKGGVDKSGLTRYADEFSWEDVVQEYVVLYAEMVKS